MTAWRRRLTGLERLSLLLGLLWPRVPLSYRAQLP